MTRSDPAPLSSLGLPAGKQARLHRILYQHGVGNGTAMFLPYDQGLEHGPRDFFANPAASDPRYIVRLAVEGGFNGIAIQIGLAEKFYWEYAGEVPLVLKLNGKTDIPPDDEPLSPLQRDRRGRRAARRRRGRLHALRRHARAGRATSTQYRQVRAATPSGSGMPLIVWAYPRGSAIEAKGGKDSFYAVDYAARTASELGRRRRQGELPAPDEARRREAAVRRASSPPSRRSTPWSVPRTARCCSSPAASKAGDEAMLEKARAVDGGRGHRADLRPQRLAARARRVASIRRRAEGLAGQIPSYRLAPV